MRVTFTAHFLSGPWWAGIFLGVLALFLAVNIRASEAMSCPAGSTAGDIGFGEHIACSIDVAGEQDFFTFSGVSGEAVYVRVARTNPSPLVLEARIFRPDNSSLCNGTTASFSDTACVLNVTGTFKIRVSNPVSSATGPYVLYLQNLTTPVNAAAASYGDNYPGNLAAGHVAAFTFSALAGENIFVRFAQAAPSASLDPEFKIYGSGGVAPVTLLGQDCKRFSSTSAFRDCNIDVDDAYTVLAFDHNASGSGDYVFYLQNESHRQNTTVTTFGQNYSGILGPGQVADFTFTAAENEAVYVRFARAAA
ncbi:MAG: hypothetical protein FJ316_00180 [SAR202 cluster bacterium]|nr:hypothetical protein [SAR202 cluster bacterium]